MNPNEVNRPKAVSQAVTMMYIVIASGFINVLFLLPPSITALGIGIVIFFVAIIAGIILFFTRQIWRGKNWARITLLVLCLLGILPSIPNLLQAFSANVIDGLIQSVQWILEIVALIFLFRKESSAWFRAKTIARLSSKTN